MIKFWSPEKTYQKIKPEIDEAIQKFLEKGELVLGSNKDIEEFEKMFAEYIGVKYAVMTGGGTHSLFLAYKACDIGPGDEVITVSHTYIATIDQIAAVGARPILVDIGGDGLIDPEKVKERITGRTRAIVPVHLEGKPCDMKSLREIAKENNLFLIDDTAQAVGASIDGKKIGTWANISCFSLYPAKILGSIGNAGIVTTDDPILANKVAEMRNHCHIGKNPNLDEPEWGYNLEPDGIQAVVLKIKMKYLGNYLARRREIAEFYNRELKNLPIVLPLESKNRVYQDYVIRVPEHKEELIKHLGEKGIGILGHNLIPNHFYLKLGLYFDLPKTEKYIKEQIRIPCNPDLTDDEVEYIVKSIKSFYAN